MNKKNNEEKEEAQQKVQEAVAEMQIELAPEYGVKKINSEILFRKKAEGLLM